MSVTMLEVDELVDVKALQGLDGRELAELFKQLERLRRRTEGALAAVIGMVNERGVHGRDGHGNVSGWCRALGRWSDNECRDRIRTANLIRSDARFRDAVLSGEIGVAQSHELGRAFANPRCGTQLVDVAEVMVDNATKLSHHEFRITVRRWEMLADSDGAHKTAEAAHEGRRAGIAEVGEEIHINARGGLAQGAVMTEIFERFCDAEFTADWDQTLARFGEAACYSLMPRSDAQRRFDAMYAIFERAATVDPGAKAVVPLVNLVLDVPTLERYLAGTGDIAVPADPRRRRCETVSGIPIPPADIVAAMIWGQVRRVVVDSAGVVINLGRRRRLFTGNARQAILLQSSRCVVAGCAAPIRCCEADHMKEWSRLGHTDGPNGAPVCGRHNRLKNSGYRVHRDDQGFWRTYRPDGTEIC
jgi:Domain of unknown function (DUF222)